MQDSELAHLETHPTRVKPVEEHRDHSNALRISPDEIVSSGLCTGCGACAGMQNNLRMTMDPQGFYHPTGEGSGFPSDQFSRVCPSSPVAANEDDLAMQAFPDLTKDENIGRWSACFAGAVSDSAVRMQGSSGGFGTWILQELLDQNLIDGVAHVQPRKAGESGPLFRFHISRTSAEISQGAKSRYYPVEMSGVFSEIRKVPGRYAVVGIPCFLKAVRLACRLDPVLAERIAFCIGLFCGHMKSARLAESFAWQMGCSPEEMEKFNFRKKDPARPASTYTAELKTRNGQTLKKDWWNMLEGDWGAGFFQNPACDFCDDVVGETADVSIGDAWREPYTSDGRGTNVLVVRSPVIRRLVEEGAHSGRLTLDAVTPGFVAETQAAGFRHRREGLAWRLTWPRTGIQPRKRVQPTKDVPLRRKCIYLIRRMIAVGSHRIYAFGTQHRIRGLYRLWARGMYSIYEGAAYLRGRWGPLFRSLEKK